MVIDIQSKLNIKREKELVKLLEDYDISRLEESDKLFNIYNEKTIIQSWVDELNVLYHCSNQFENSKKTMLANIVLTILIEGKCFRANNEVMNYIRNNNPFIHKVIDKYLDVFMFNTPFYIKDNKINFSILVNYDLKENILTCSKIKSVIKSIYRVGKYTIIIGEDFGLPIILNTEHETNDFNLIYNRVHSFHYTTQKDKIRYKHQ